MDILEFLEKRAKPCKEDRQHKKLLDNIISNLPFIGINDHQYIFREVIIPNGRVDLIVLTDEIYLIEAKVLRSHNSKSNATNELNRQLRKAYDFFLSEYNISCNMVGVFRNKGSSRFNSYRLDKPIEHLLYSANFIA
ncbi:MAG: hypothetical protein ACMXYG_02875 [Candidatus Woesearchaeota archaeon]